MITAPVFRLKQCQKKIFSFLRWVERPDWLMSSEKGKNYVTNAKAHVENSYCLTIDINKFYDNCMRDAVYQFFNKKLECAPDISKILTDFATYDGGLPTGTPVSQILAYYSYEKMFKEIKDIAELYKTTFTLYVDDMTFSSNEWFSAKRLIYDVRKCLNKYGHSLRERKTRFYSKNKPKLVTGVIITTGNKIAIPNGKRKQIMEGLAPLNDGSIDFLQARRLVGRLLAAQQIEENSFSEAKKNATKKLKELQMKDAIKSGKEK